MSILSPSIPHLVGYSKYKDFPELKTPTYLTAKKALDYYENVISEEFIRFYRNNPNILFIRAAGNNGIDLNSIPKTSSHISEPNVISIGSIRNQKYRSSYSNYSSEYVQLGANGENISGALSGGGSIYLSGTSMAAALVSNRIAKVIHEEPTLSLQETLIRFYKNETLSLPHLKNIFSDGRIMNSRRKASGT